MDLISIISILMIVVCGSFGFFFGYALAEFQIAKKKRSGNDCNKK